MKPQIGTTKKAPINTAIKSIKAIEVVIKKSKNSKISKKNKVFYKAVIFTKYVFRRHWL